MPERVGAGDEPRFCESFADGFYEATWLTAWDRSISGRPGSPPAGAPSIGRGLG
jgi:hypothetical protein